MLCLDHKASSKAFKGFRLQRVTSGLTPGLQCYFAGTTNPHRYSGRLCTHSRQAYSFRSIILNANFVIYFFPFGRKQFFSFLSFNIVKYSYKSALLSVKYLLMPLSSDIHVSLRVHYNSWWFLKLLSVTLINLIFNLSKRPRHVGSYLIPLHLGSVCSRLEDTRIKPPTFQLDDDLCYCLSYMLSCFLHVQSWWPYYLQASSLVYRKT